MVANWFQLGHPLWCSYAQWWHPTESELLPLLHSGTLIWLLCPTRLIACTSSSWVWMDHQYTNAYYLCWSPCVCCQTCFLWWPGCKLHFSQTMYRLHFKKSWSTKTAYLCSFLMAYITFDHHVSTSSIYRVMKPLIFRNIEKTSVHIYLHLFF